MNDQSRYRDYKLPMPVSLWKDISQPTEGSVEKLLKGLEYAVSNGFFGVACMLSDYLRATSLHELDADPYQRVRLEIEYMKRMDYMGYDEPFFAAANSVLNLISDIGDQLEVGKVTFAKFTAYGHSAWKMEGDELNERIDHCETLVESCTDERNQKILRGFLFGLEGRQLALKNKKDKTKSIKRFEKGLKLLEEFPRSRIHLQMHFSEHLKVLNEWQLAIKVAEEILFTALNHDDLKSHLLLRAVLLILMGPEKYIQGHRRKQLQFSCWALIHGMGLSQLETVSPFLSRVTQQFDRTGDILFRHNKSSHIYEWMQSLHWKKMERVVAAYYTHLGFDVYLPGDNRKVFDLFAKKEKDGCSMSIAIQVKHWKSKLTASKLPDTDLLEEAKLRIEDEKLVPPKDFRWFVSGGYNDDSLKKLKIRLQKVFGHDDLKIISLAEFVGLVAEADDPRCFAHILLLIMSEGGNA